MAQALSTLINALADGEFHSGAALAEQFNITRAAIWKRIRQLADVGLEVERVRGQGYRLAQPLDLLTDAGVARHMGAATRQRLAFVDIVPVLGSSNHWLMERMPTLSPGQSGVCLAECQTAGRGRRGRVWVSPYGANLYLSVGWYLHDLPPEVGALGLAASVTVVEVLEDLGFEGITLKWPNDVYYRGQKLGGVLVDLQGQPGGEARIVIGVGLNIDMARTAAADVNQLWVNLSAVGGVEKGLRERLAGRLTHALINAMDRFVQRGFAPFRDAWVAHDAAADAPVELQMEQQAKTGIARGVSEHGALCLEVDGEVQLFFSGEVSLKMVARA